MTISSDPAISFGKDNASLAPKTYLYVYKGELKVSMPKVSRVKFEIYVIKKKKK